VDNKISIKNYDFIKAGLKVIDEVTREGLSGVAKDFGNSIIFEYEHLAKQINEQRCENLRLQMEIATLIKEKNSIRHEMKNLYHQVKKLEVCLGATPCPIFENMLNQNIYT